MTEEQSIAEELSAKQREISVAEFFEQNRQMLGFGSQARAMVTAVKEGVDNAIDAAEDAGILPYVRVSIEQTEEGYYQINITDNGPGITEENVPKVFGKLLYGSRFAKRVQRRGQQGIGISAAVLYSQHTTGMSAKVTSKVLEKDNAEYFEVGIDTDSNEPEVQKSQETTWDEEFDSGTSITLHLEANFRARKALHKYIRHTAIVNPHATVEIHEPQLNETYDRTVEELPEQPTEIDPHPHGIEFGTLRSMLDVTDSHSISGFVQSEFTRVGKTTADKIIRQFIDIHKGRYCAFHPPSPNQEIDSNALDTNTAQGQLSDFSSDNGETLNEYVKSHVNRKPQRVKDKLATKISDSITNEELVSYQLVRSIVTDVATTVENNTGTTLGETVQEKVITATWNYVKSTRKRTYNELITNCVSERKSQKDIETFSTKFITLLDNKTTDETYQFTHDELQTIVETTSKKIDSEISSTFGEKAQQNIVTAIWESTDPDSSDPPLIRQIATDRNLAESLHEAMQAVDVIAPPSDCLSPIGAEEMKKGLMKVYDCDFYAGASRSAASYSGEPFLVEAGIAYGGELESNSDISLLRFANRVPLVYQQGACLTTDVISDINWNNYKLSDKGGGLPQGPVAISVHVASTNVPFTSESKDAVATVDVIAEEIERAIREVARELKSHLKKEQDRKERREKNNTVSQLLPHFSDKISSITGRETPRTNKSIAKIMNNLFLSTTHDDDDTTLLTLQNNSPTNETLTIYITTSNTGEDITTDHWSKSDESTDEKYTEIQINTDEVKQIPIGKQVTVTNISTANIPEEKITLDTQ
jgi:DNA topoisomerase-6 subunit B